ncbi:MAG: Asp-tRNA(Asn)/Glu-tRNA(Gln) amidotransferase subunit GatB [Patescibacteria group bacterium]|nr:Asp-tRNA(Asn)/Glu-tRNA(Gln) amidotransferase subunit GatB [Patescibacteria group bacterium]
MDKYDIVIGLEIHAQLRTESKMFCTCDNYSVGAGPNKNTCPICLGMPGMLPVPNKKAIEWTYLLGMALGAKVAEKFCFERKNYFYPDLPKAYQITSSTMPPIIGGSVEIDDNDVLKKIRINHVHLEEDAGKLIHPKIGEYSLVDLNRAGTPLLEIVTEPDLRSPREARIFVQDLRSILRYLGISDANMEQGNLRCDANISLKPQGQKELGTKVEVKNMNSFKMIERALEHEVKRQEEILSENKKIVQETRGWDDAKGKTLGQRSKEEANDYRYFPEPDIPSIEPNKDNSIDLKEIKNWLPELPKEKRIRFETEYSLSKQDADNLTSDLDLARYFEQTLAEIPQVAGNDEIKKQKAKKLANWLITELLAKLNGQGISILDCKIKHQNFAVLIEKIDSGKISGKIAKEIFSEMFVSGRGVEEIIKEKGLSLISDEKEIETIIRAVISENTASVQDYKSGKEKAFGYLVGQVMAKTKGQANPQIVNKLLKEFLDKE